MSAYARLVDLSKCGMNETCQRCHCLFWSSRRWMDVTHDCDSGIVLHSLKCFSSTPVNSTVNSTLAALGAGFGETLRTASSDDAIDAIVTAITATHPQPGACLRLQNSNQKRIFVVKSINFVECGNCFFAERLTMVGAPREQQPIPLPSLLLPCSRVATKPFP